MQLKEVLDGLTVLSVRADLTREITGVSYNSRRVEAGHVFAAIPGEETDGSRYAAQAVRRGAVCVLCQRPLEGLPHVVVPSARQALAVAGANWYGWPARQLRVIGVTGTNGKTSTAFSCGISSGRVSVRRRAWWERWKTWWETECYPPGAPRRNPPICRRCCARWRTGAAPTR